MVTAGSVLLAVDSVTVRFGGLVALDRVSLEVQEGEILGIIGPNGAGKTTLFNTITGDIKPYSGRVLLQGENITGLSPHVICRKGIARTFQLTLLFPELTVMECVWVGVNSVHRLPWNPVVLADKDLRLKEEVGSILSLVGLWEKRDQKAGTLSYGDQKILEIAMAISIRPKILLLDEPTQGVDPGETQKVVEVIRKLSEKMTIVVIEHNMDVVLELCRRIIVLNEGRKLADGSPKEIRENGDVQKVYIGEEL
ncbi:MAG: ABC transporter ATP-binding protein [Candidatus Hadarchaeum sp.]|uniref:ABC transporter ATP-binding protein n=1 Tax=Candidatus Hadarchaeum sp. TaxID=2883567 RepID=UPI003170C57D